jgi:large subunit ribosomal protein L5
MSEGNDEKPEKAPKAEQVPKAEKAEKAEKSAKAEKAEAKGDGKAAKGGGGKAAKAGKPAEGEAAAAPREKKPKTPPRLQVRYKKDVVPRLQQEFNYKNPMMVPKMEKVVLNVSIKEAIANVKILEAASDELAAISGQKPVIRRARKSIANFKLREGMPIGTSVTLRREHMWEFLDRFFALAMPRIRDFRGVSRKAFDGRGNYTLGLKEQIIFPEIDYDKVERIHGMNITFVTSARTDAESLALLSHLGMPFRAQ